MTDMIIFVSAILSLGLVALCALKWRRRKAGVEMKNDSVAQLEDVLRAAELSNASFFQSLQLVQKNLESLLTRAESAEQRLRAMMLQPGGRKRSNTPPPRCCLAMARNRSGSHRCSICPCRRSNSSVSCKG